MTNKEKIKILSDFVTPERFRKFEKIIKNRTRYFTVVIENVYQSHNASAILRTCDCFGIQDIHVIEVRNKFKVNPEIALGSEKWLTIYTYEGENAIINCYESLRKKGYKIAATVPNNNSLKITDLAVENKYAFVFGAELNGLSDIACENADISVYIPMYGFAESFNVSVSAAICLFHVTEKMRNCEKILWQLFEQEEEEIILQWLKNSIPSAENILKEKEKELRKK